MLKSLVKGAASLGDGVIANTLKPLTNPQTVGDRPPLTDDDERKFGKGSFHQLLGILRVNLTRSNEQSMRSNEQSMRTKYLTYDKSTALTNLTEDFDINSLGAGGWTVLNDQVYTDSKQNKPNKKAAMLDYKELVEECLCQSEDASKFFNFMTVLIIIPCVLHSTVIFGFSTLTLFLCCTLISCIIVHFLLFMYLIALMLNVIEECDIFGKTEQLSVHVQDDPFVQIKCRKEFRSRDVKLLCDKLNYNRIECDYVSRRRDREPSRIPAKKPKRLSQKTTKLKVFVGKQILKQIPLSSKLYPYIKC